MEIVKAYSRRLLLWILFVFGLICGLFNVGVLYLIEVVPKIVESATYKGTLSQRLIDFFENIDMIIEMLALYFFPVSSGFFLLFALILWISLRISLKGLMKKKGLLDQKEAGKDDKDTKPKEPGKERLIKDKRLFLHLLSVFQREGRLVDFFREDLDDYEDEQIGSAVRSIHENCKKVLDKYFVFKTVVNEDEGDEIELEEDFDPAAVKLTGNVTGEPPFKGVVRHRGWKADKLDLPTLSGGKDPHIIAPAEVEL